MRSENEAVHYRARFELHPDDLGMRAFDAVTDVLRRWVIEKEKRRGADGATVLEALMGCEGAEGFKSGTLSAPKNYVGGARRGRTTSICSRCSRAEDDCLSAWAFEYDESDGERNFRHWHTSVGVVPEDQGKCVVNARVAYYTTPDYLGQPLSAPLSATPNFMKGILRLKGISSFVGDTLVQREVRHLNVRSFDSEFRAGLLDGSRKLPFVLVTSDENGAFPIGGLEELSSKLLGMANVYLVDWSDAELRSRLFGLFRKGTTAYRYGCSRSCLRVYRPGLNLDNEYDSKHRYFTREQIASLGERRLFDILAKSLSQSVARGEKDVVDLQDIARLDSSRTIARLAGRLKDLKSQSDKLALSDKDSADLVGLRRKLEQSERLRSELAASVDEVLNEATAAQDQASELQRLNEALESKNEGLAYQLEEQGQTLAALRQSMGAYAREAKALENLRHIPTSLSDVLALVGETWPDRLAVLPEAKKSAGEFPGSRLDEQWQILSSMATVLWPLYFDGKGEEADISSEYQRRTGFELALTEKKLTKGSAQMMRERKRLYDGREIDVTPHIKGKEKNPKFAFRVHFYADQEGRKIVIGHCGGHLTTAGTRHVS